MIETIETERCILRKVSLDDAESIFAAYAQDDDVTRYLSWLPHQSIQDTIDFVKRSLDRWDSGESYLYLVVQKESNTVIGAFDFRPIDGVATFGYLLAKKWRGKGYMTEVLFAMISAGFSDFGFRKIIGYCDVENTASASVMEKSGMQYVGIEKGHLTLPFYGEDKRDAKMYEIYPV